MNTKIAVIGLGYVGLPLAVELAKHYHVIGFDINKNRLEELRKGKDHTLEVEESNLISVLNQNDQIGLSFTDDAQKIKGFDFYIITV
ncbi:MAG TPA: NAD(P)-binding domain-containing protein, partial [Saprospiraceae bacterium]|nr:NAD(P)-binding domain-containing protein [Saprospiraceae bacterium]